MSESSAVQTMTVELHLPPLTKWEREYRAFLRLLPELLKTCCGKYVAVHAEEVTDSGDDELALASRVWSKVGYVPIHIGLVTEQPRPIARVPSFREISYK